MILIKQIQQNYPRLQKYINFVDRTPQRKRTKVIQVYNQITEECVGTIKWNGGWRKYVFCTQDGFMDAEFMHLIADICDALMLDRQMKKEMMI